jgi:hypothetical protein
MEKILSGYEMAFLFALAGFELGPICCDWFQVYTEKETRNFQIDYHTKKWYEYKEGGKADSPTETFAKWL